MREATEDEAAEAVVADAPAAREGGLLLDEGHRALRHGAQLRRAPLVTLLRRLHPIVHPHRVEHALALHVVAQGCDAPLRLLTVAHRVLQPPHLLVVRHVRVEARAVARQRPRDVAVARLPRPDVPPVVRGGGQREGLEAVPLGEEGEDRLVVAVLLEARVLPRRLPRVRDELALRRPREPLAQEAQREGRLAQHHEPRVELHRVEHLVGRIERVGELALGPASICPAGEVEGDDASGRVLPQAVESAQVVPDGQVVVEVHEDLLVTQRLEAAQQGVRLPPPVACASAATRRTVSLGPARRQVLQRQVRAGGDDRPHLCRPAAFHSREVGELAVASEGGGVPRRVLRADRLTPAPVLPRRLPVEDW